MAARVPVPARGQRSSGSFVSLALPLPGAVHHSVAAPAIDESMVPLAVDEALPKPPSGEAVDGWEAATDEHGTVYFYNLQTGETSWSKPKPT
jgi:hypothetical protein